jgi:hypothetical protein
MVTTIPVFLHGGEPVDRDLDGVTAHGDYRKRVGTVTTGLRILRGMGGIADQMNYGIGNDGAALVGHGAGDSAALRGADGSRDQ